MFLIFTLPLILISTGIASTPVMIILFVISGFGMAGMGMGVMHDANHGSFSGKSSVNKFFSRTLDFMGCSSAVWKLQHNVLHHTFTNIDDHDQDISAPFFLRFSPNTKKYFIQRFQHLYVWLFYGMTTFHWVTAKDFIALNRYYKMGLIKSKTELRREIFRAIGWKLFYFSYTLVLPILFSGLPVLWILTGFLAMHFVTGVFLTTIFQLAHVMPEMDFPKPDENNAIQTDWHIHQLRNTSNFAPNSRILSWFIGGLNFQIEHHLFPNISHVHYKDISKIISKTAREFNVPYHVHRNVFVAVWKHIVTLRRLGNMRTATI